MEAVAGLAENLVQQIGCTVDDQVLFDKVRMRVYATEDFQHAQPVERAVGVPYGIQNLGGAVASSGISFLRRC
jgi:hypothetical protein